MFTSDPCSSRRESRGEAFCSVNEPSADIRTIACPFCPTAEHASAVSYNSAQCKQVDVALKESCRIVTGCLKLTPFEKVYYLEGIPPSGDMLRDASK